MTSWRARSKPPTNGSCSAPAFASATSRRPGEMTSDLALHAAQGGARQCPCRGGHDRPDRAGDLDARPDLSGHRGGGAGRARHHAWRRLRSAGGVLGLRLCACRSPTRCCARGSYKRALVIGAETFSRILDWNDRTTCVLFGDGAGAVVLEAQEQAGHQCRPRHPHHPSALGRPPQGQALCRRRAVLDPDRRPSAHGRARGVQARRRHDHRRDR